MPDDNVRPSFDRPEVDLDHNSRQHAENWKEEFREMRAKTPRPWSTAYGGFWVALKYKDIIGIGQKFEAFSSHKDIDPVTGDATGGASIPPINKFRAVPNESHSPEWNHVRTFLNRRYAPQAVEGYRAKAERWAAALIDQFIEKGACDLVTELTSPLPALVMMDVFGLPMGEWRDFADLFHKLLYVPTDHPEHHATVAKLDYFLRERVDEEIALRREGKKPGDDLLSYLAHGELEGKKLDRTMLHNMCFNLIGGGVGTTAALTSHMLLYLARNPKDRARLINEPDLWPVATEEFVRYFSIVHGQSRNVLNDVDVDGWHFKKGERVMLMFSSANRDEEIFDEPDKLKLDRFPNRHIGFGAGMHRCIGSFFARMLFQVMAKQVLARIPDYKVNESGAVPNPCVAISDGWVHMPATFTPGKKLGVPLPTEG